MRLIKPMAIVAAIGSLGGATAVAQSGGAIPSEAAQQSRVAADAVAMAEVIARLLTSAGYRADFSLESLKEIDRFFDEQMLNGQPKPDGLLAEQFGARVFAIGGYVGEVIRRHEGGVWLGDDNDPEAEFNIAVAIRENSVIWPMQRVMKRAKNGPEDSIWVYGSALTRKKPN